MADALEFKEYVSRRIVVKALQFDPDGMHKFSLPPMITSHYQDAKHSGLSEEGPTKWPQGWATFGIKFFMLTISGKSFIRPGDYIVEEMKYPGKFYPCDKSTFERRYIV